MSSLTNFVRMSDGNMTVITVYTGNTMCCLLQFRTVLGILFSLVTYSFAFSLTIVLVNCLYQCIVLLFVIFGFQVHGLMVCEIGGF
jgi:hypothetical protein